MNKRNLKNIEWSILICILLLVIIGLIALYSASQGTELDAFKKQCIWILISIPIMCAVMFIDYNVIARFSWIFYAVFMILLVVVLFTGAINGATSWFNMGLLSFQPGELAKIFVILFLSYTIVNIQANGKNQINRPSKLAIVLLIGLAPTFLIAIQPDYGTALAYIVAITLILYVAGIDKKYIITTFAILVIALPLLYFFVLPDHAKSRIEVYLNPNLDPRGAGYNIIQSKLAIGAGKLFGMGWLNGTQTQLGFLYPKTTDFIFPVIVEELGVLVGILILLVYTYIIFRILGIAKRCYSLSHSMICYGVASYIFVHVFINLVGVLGLLPLTGVPLPFLSYGGSYALCLTISLTIVQRINYETSIMRQEEKLKNKINEI